VKGTLGLKEELSVETKPVLAVFPGRSESKFSFILTKRDRLISKHFYCRLTLELDPAAVEDL